MTEVYNIESLSQGAAAIEHAAEALRAGRLVAFPTETVYGLGANALDSAAVARIFAAKGRPANNPLIVHVNSTAAARELTAEWPATAELLAARFWPGPLTLVLRKHSSVPDITTAGADTVAVRAPAHPVALALIGAAKIPVAAPSANRSCEVSPTTAEHVRKSLADRVDVVLNGGPTSGGLESTVLDLSVNPPRLLRPGMIAPSVLENVIGTISRPQLDRDDGSKPLASPGTSARHYAPRAPMELRVPSDSSRLEQLVATGAKIGWLALARPTIDSPALVLIQMPTDPIAFAARLYAALHELDGAGVGRIIVDMPPDDEAWLAVRDRLRRGAAPGERGT